MSQNTRMTGKVFFNLFEKIVRGHFCVSGSFLEKISDAESTFPVPEGELLGVESEFLMEDFGEVAEIGVPYAIHYLIDRKCSVLGKE